MFQKIVGDWNNMEGEILDANGDPVENNKRKLTAYAVKFGLTYRTLYNYFRANVSKRMVIGNCVGVKPLMRQDQVLFVACISSRADCGNEGLTPMYLTNKVQELCPHLDHKQAYRQVHRRVLLEGHKARILKKNTVKAQATTTDRTGITVSDQYRWHLLVNSDFERLQLQNTGTCPDSKKTFGEVMDSFVFGLDKMSIAADHAGNIRVIPSANKKKHNNILQDR